MIGLAVTIGRASIKVYPDTKGFRRETLRKLKGDLKDLDRELANDDKSKVKIPAEFDVDQKKSARNFKEFLDKLENQKVRLRVDFDADVKDLNKRIRDQVQKVRVELDSDKAWGDFQQTLARMDGESVEVDLDIRENTRLIRDAVEHIGEQISHAMRDSVRDGVEQGADDVRNSSSRVKGDDVVDRPSFEKVFHALGNDLKNFGRRFKDELTLDKPRRELERMTEEAGRLNKGLARIGSKTLNGLSKIAVDLNMTHIDEQIHKVKSKLDDLIHDYNGKDIELEPTLDHTSLWTVRAQLMALARDRWAMIHVKVKQSSLNAAKRALNGIYSATGLKTGVKRLQDVADWLENIGDKAPMITGVASAVVALAGGAIGAVGSIGHLANEMVRMSGAGLALPGILGGAAIGVGTFITAIKNFNTEVPEVGQGLSKIGDEINKQFWHRARVPLLEAWNKMLPSLERGFSKTAKALGGWTASFSSALGERFKGGELNPMFDNLAKSIDIASKSGKNFADIVEIMGRRGSEYLPRLAQWGNDVTAGFRNWLDQADKSGELTRWMDTGIQKMKELGVIARESGEFIYLIGKSAERAGFSGLGEMARGLEDVTDKMKTLNGQKTLDTYFRGAGKVLGGVKRAIGEVIGSMDDFAPTFETAAGHTGDAIGTIGEIFGDLMKNKAFQGGLEKATEGFAKGLEHIKKAGDGVGDFFGAFGELAGTVVENIGKILGGLFEGFGPELKKMVDDLAPKIDTLGDSISNFIKTLGGSSVGKGLMKLITFLASSVLDDASRNLDKLSGALDGIDNILSLFKGGDGGGYGGVGKSFGQIIGGLMTLLSPAQWALKAMDWTAEKLGLGGFVESMQKSFEIILPKIEGVIKTFKDRLDGFLNFFKGIWEGFKNGLKNLFSPGGGGDSGASPFGSGTTNLFGALGLPDLSQLGAKFGEAIEKVKSTIQGIWDGFKSFIAGIFGGGGEAGGSGLQFNIGAVDNASGVIGAVVSKATEWAGRAWNAVVGAFDQAGQIISDVVSRARSWASGVYQAAMTAVNRAGSTISGAVAAAKRWAGGLYRAALTAVSKISGVVSSARNQLVAWARARYQAALTALNRVASGVASARSAINAWARAKYQAALTALNRTAAGIASARSAINGLVRQRFQATVTVIAHGIESVQNRIRAIQGKTVSVVTNMVKRFVNANGNIFDSVKKYANGGINLMTGRTVDHRVRMMAENHVAQIAPAGSMRLWAEPETGGEAYIPLAKSKRSRSEAILSDVANRFGGEFRKFADGSDHSRAVASGGDTYNMTFPTMKADVAGEVSDELMFRLRHLRRGGAQVA